MVERLRQGDLSGWLQLGISLVAFFVGLKTTLVVLEARFDAHEKSQAECVAEIKSRIEKLESWRIQEAGRR